MDVEDLGAVPAGTSLSADVCIVGGGPAGLTLARELSGSGRRVIVLESGDHDRTDWADALDSVDNIGAPRVNDQWKVRNRLLGGSSNTWTGRVATFDAVDFATRDWVPSSGWPIDRDELAPYFARTPPYFGIDIADNNAPWVRDLLAGGMPPFDPALFRPYGWSRSHDPAQPGVPMRFGPLALREPMAGVTCYLRATATQLETDATGTHIERVEVRAPDGRRRWVRARQVVLAAGGVENARLLLASTRSDPAGLGNRYDRVGRYLMDHPRIAVGSFRPADHFAVQRALGDLYVSHPVRATLEKGVTLSPEVQRSEQLVNAALFVQVGDVEVDTGDPIRALQALARLHRPALQLQTLVRNRAVLAENLRDLLIERRRPRVRSRTYAVLFCMVEQAPDPESRITLGNRIDAFGSRLPVIDWRVGEAEKRTIRFATTAFVAELARLGLPTPELEAMISDPGADLGLLDVAHPTGTTRMSEDPRFGVVDRNCAVHGVAGLYVAGSSVFPTTGHANPTQMIVALAVRLADHLKRSASSEAPEVSAATVTPKPRSAPSVTGSMRAAAAAGSAAGSAVGSAAGAGQTTPSRPHPHWWSGGRSAR